MRDWIRPIAKAGQTTIILCHLTRYVMFLSFSSSCCCCCCCSSSSSSSSSLVSVSQFDDFEKMLAYSSVLLFFKSQDNRRYVLQNTVQIIRHWFFSNILLIFRRYECSSPIFESFLVLFFRVSYRNRKQSKLDERFAL